MLLPSRIRSHIDFDSFRTLGSSSSFSEQEASVVALVSLLVAVIAARATLLSTTTCKSELGEETKESRVRINDGLTVDDGLVGKLERRGLGSIRRAQRVVVLEIAGCGNESRESRFRWWMRRGGHLLVVSVGGEEERERGGEGSSFER